MKSGWELPQEVLIWVDENLPEGSLILEFGSGHGSVELSKNYELISVEHDEKWLGLSQGQYIHAEIVSNQTSSKYSEKGWYNQEKLHELPAEVDAIIIDGPPGQIGRIGILEFLPMLPKTQFIIVDDTDRIAEKKLLNELAKKLAPLDQVEITSRTQRSNGEPRKATVLILR
tara:strand:- start:1958 stop:2473 length:516 start_codon:yes stop_codon:yes gene_type:complete